MKKTKVVRVYPRYLTYCGRCKDYMEEGHEFVYHSRYSMGGGSKCRWQDNPPRVAYKVNLGDWGNPAEYIDFKTIEDRDKCLKWIDELLQQQKEEIVSKLEKALKDGASSTLQMAIKIVKE